MPALKLTCDEVAIRVLNTIRSMLQRPVMFSATPQSMEETLAALDKVRVLLVCGETDELPRYTRFLIKRGFGSSNFCNRWVEKNPNGDLREMFQALTTFWEEYLEDNELVLEYGDCCK